VRRVPERGMTVDADFWQILAIGLGVLIVLSIVAAAVWSYLFGDRER